MITAIVLICAAFALLGMLAMALWPLLAWSGVSAFLEARELRAQADAMDEFLAEL